MRIAKGALRLLRWLRAKRLAGAISKIELSKCLNEYKNTDDFLLVFRSRKKPLFFLSGNNLRPLMEVLPQSGGILEDADQVCAHNFDLLGSGKTNVDRLVISQVSELEKGKETRKLGNYQQIDWHKDFKISVRWNPDVLYDTETVKGSGSDIKVPWELSRFQHLPTLGKAYWLTGDNKYAKEFVDEISDWIDTNPPQYGVNWTGTMDIAIRAVNWIWGYYFFEDSPEVSDEFLLKSLKSLYIHGKHIRANLEHASRAMAFANALLNGKLAISILKPGWRGMNGNHYLSDIVGLIYLGVMFPEFKEARKWREFGIKELINEMKGQVHADGIAYEGSISYHRLVTELFLSATLLCLKNGIIFPDWYMQRLEKMIKFVMYYTKPDGTAPQIGDNDDGRLHILADYENWNRLDHQYLLSIGAVLFNRPDFKQAAGEFHEEAFWLLGEEGQKVFEAL